MLVWFYSLNHNKPPLKSLFGFSHKAIMSSVLSQGSQHQGTRITSGTASVVEVIWFPDVGFAKSCCLSFVLFVPLVLFGVEWSVCKLLLCKLSLKLSLSHFC